MKTIATLVPIVPSSELWPGPASADLFVAAGGHTIYELTAFAGGRIPCGLAFDSEEHRFAANGKLDPSINR